MKNENEYLKTQLRKSRKENPTAVLAGNDSSKNGSPKFFSQAPLQNQAKMSW